MVVRPPSITNHHTLIARLKSPESKGDSLSRGKKTKIIHLSKVVLYPIDPTNLSKVAKLVIKETQILNIVLQNAVITKIKDSRTSTSIMLLVTGSVGFKKIYVIPEVTSDYKSKSSKL